MNLLHRYLLRELVGTTFAAVGLFTFVLLTGNAMKDLLGRLADGLLTVGLAVEMIVMLIPYVLMYSLPIGLLTGILLTFGRLSAQHEITAMRTAGIGIARLAAPALLIGVLGVAAGLVVNYQYAPKLRGRYREILADVGRKNPLNLIVPNTFIRDFPGVVVRVGGREGMTLRDVWVWKGEKDQPAEVIAFGREAVLTFEEPTNILHLELRRATVHYEPFNLEKPPLIVSSEVAPFTFSLDEVFQRREFVRKVAWLNIVELLQERRRLAASAAPADRERLLKVQMTIHESSALAFSVLSFVLVGVPLGIQTGRKETSANLGIALLLTMGYYFLMISAGWLENHPQYHPELLLWLPNIVFQAFGGWLWWRFGRN